MTAVTRLGGVCVPQGFMASGIKAGIKRSGSLDLAVIFSERPSAAAGLFTTNRVAAAPVLVSRERVQRGSARGAVVNSGCANACTGERGYRDALAMTAITARALDVEPEEVLVCSTGLIGSYLPMDLLEEGIPKAVAAMDRDDELAASAIMTTDTRPKMAAVTTPKGWSIGGIAKGAGMIAPNLATMLAFMTTDANVGIDILGPALTEAASDTFNAITVDGDTSTNDTVLAFANGASGIAPDPEEFAVGLRSVCRDLAEQVVADGEGATKLIRVAVRGAASIEQAREAARTVAQSTLVKTAVYGQDANWGRVVAALGRSGVTADFERLSVKIAGVTVLDQALPASSESIKRAREAMEGPEVGIECDLAAGKEAAEVLTTDLTPEYVRINAEYET